MAATTGELLVTVHGATDLQDCEEWGDMDPYVTLAFTSPAAEGAASAATRTSMKGGTNPTWQDETLALPVTADPGQLRVEVWNQNRAAPDDLVGFGQCSIYEALQGGGPSELAVPLTAHPSGKAQGFVHLRLAFRPLPPDQAAAAARAEMAGAGAE
ncbi:elicitor-responsive 1-like isoform X1 [Chlorella sorokiniana]|uniref:Elicitor-responsive 1-like isoform X1 n=1 Tax=Chlorella sorokiniana TaxID=3076 RepID=A0A2P6TW10_CHLSO|nr:elicitor-responsive 1-like isoform X1 [Chlorella sorokiniana]|eukprot:PRW58246.1 elicitor-responsive 1-like isoform X1 [Chlorella sorokiniana]